MLIDAYPDIKSKSKAREIMQQYGLTRKYTHNTSKSTVTISQAEYDNMKNQIAELEQANEDLKEKNKTNDNIDNMNIVTELLQQVEELQRQINMQQVTINNLTEQLSKANQNVNASANVTHSEQQQYSRVGNQFVTAEQAEINNAQVQQASQQKMSDKSNMTAAELFEQYQLGQEHINQIEAERVAKESEINNVPEPLIEQQQTNANWAATFKPQCTPEEQQKLLDLFAMQAL